MTGFIVSTVLTSTYSIASTNSYYIAKPGAVYSTALSGYAITNAATTTSGDTLTIAGEVAAFGNGTAIYLNATSSAGDQYSTGFHRVSIMESGVVSADLYGLKIAGTYNNFDNAGDVFGEDTALFMNGGISDITNTGTLRSTLQEGIVILGDSTASSVSKIFNSGTILGGSKGIAAMYDVLNIVNAATGNISGTTGIFVWGAAASLKLTNYGTIASVEPINPASGEFDSGVFASASADSIRNFGSIIGGVVANGGDDWLLNSGTITGRVSLGNGSDIYKADGAGYVSGKIDGDAGDDVLKGGALADDMNGGVGVDILKGRGGNDILTDTSGNDSFWGGSGDDVMNAGAGANKMYGGRGDDTINAGSGSDLVKGGNGNDTITGGNGKDVIFGGDGNDVINAGGKADVIHGGGGNDIMTGSSGADTFVFTQRAGDDVITDFTNNSDKLDLRGFGISSAATIVSAATTVTGGLLIDLDLLGGSGSIFLEGFNAANLDASDFIL